MSRAAVQVDVRNRHCEEPNCTKCPSFNFPGLKPGVFCGLHKRAGMVDVKHKRPTDQLEGAFAGSSRRTEPGAQPCMRCVGAVAQHGTPGPREGGFGTLHVSMMSRSRPGPHNV